MPILLAALAAVLGTTPALADAVDAVPSGWRLQDYGDGAVTIFFSGSSCLSGQLRLSASAPEGSKDRLWATITTAKVAHHPVVIYYHPDNGTCVIDSFVFKETG